MEIEHGVTVKILFFAKSKELAGTREARITIPEKITYQQLLNIIAKNYNLETIKDHILLAKNEEVCSDNRELVIREFDNIAVIPPLSGG
ncbi:molybdopterin synthase sulfur carrier subunit [Pieris napi]|uniref:molybdopterin synthase sulfur carrier subunit n=1 Tax=Pieris rapae TaxID=64459 RepID=UPI000B927933|nr:molybdopterin synthase sulfur carrier subunit [Pieris rapae]XP_022126709.1 molybdopterin synthase sulfur carrier subunit [Pieris rapae]XP_022126718.1 molybdopterin synthase sulfur carrier subunit [Pieris rapae]XP_045485907.1 molybdopterin synthase sulfur carrier subunit [Pieris rapae]XP_047512368.1 molybdopterin synthase sulfur carrier subunit [Pieris napi]XP_047512369.1 molybdopterin synthase sulfur carrier subunit [Pieris napi]XP_047512370.1 molybdopterin synthase sulfur carrier subunit 